MHDKYRIPILDLDEKHLLEAVKVVLADAGDEILYIIDAGAASGRWTFYVREFFYEWPEKRFHLFEPVLNQFIELTRDYGELPNVELNHVALDEKSGLGVFVERPFAEHSSLDGHRDEKHLRKRAFPVLTLDDYVDFTRIPYVSLLKIDTEGAEPQILRGLSRTLAAGKVRCIQFEFGSGWTESLRRTCRWLNERDFLVFAFDGSEVVLFNPPENEAVPDPTNLLAVKVS